MTRCFWAGQGSTGMPY